MKVRCIDSRGVFGTLPITEGNIYLVLGTSEEYYTIINDKKQETNYLKCRFKEVEEMEIENVLELEYQEVFGDKVAIRVAYQNDNVLKRGDFVDLYIGVESRDFPDFRFDITHIRGIRLDSDNEVSLVSKEKAEQIKEKVRKINEKYGIRKRWRAKEGEYYFTITSTCGVFEISKTREFNDYIDDKNYESKNYFKTKEDAKETLEKIRQIFKEV